MKLNILKSAVVITPSIGSKHLSQCVESVAKQSYGNLKHMIVSDGPEFLDKIESSVSPNSYSKPFNGIITSTPTNTGKNGFYGHRIYAAYPHLVNEDYILFLDEDNWYETHHVENLINLIEEKNLDWAYSLRQVYRENEFFDFDSCESIGRWPIWFSKPENPQHLVDTSTYCFKRDFLIHVCNHWEWKWGGDRRFFHIVTKQMKHDNYDCTGLHTMCYRLPDMDKQYGGDLEFFAKGNEVIKKQYGGKFPWSKT